MEVGVLYFEKAAEEVEEDRGWFMGAQ